MLAILAAIVFAVGAFVDWSGGEQKHFWGILFLGLLLLALHFVWSFTPWRRPVNRPPN